MKFKKLFINLLIFLGINIFAINAVWPKSHTQLINDLAQAKLKIMRLNASNKNLSIKFCKKVLSDQLALHKQYDNFFGGLHIYSNLNFIATQKLWAENYDMMGLPGFTELLESLYKASEYEITHANTYVLSIYRELSLNFDRY